MADITENGVISSTGELDCAVKDSHKPDQVNGTASVNGLASKDEEVDSKNQTVPKNSSEDGEKDPEGKGAEENLKKDENSQGERRMSLRPRSTPKKYNEVLEIEEEKKKPVKSKEKLSPNDPASLPSRKQSGTVVIQMNSSTPKGTKASAKNAKATRPPPELIKAPLKQLSSSTSVTVVSKPKDSQSGLVLVNTQSPQNKKLAAVTSVPASVTVSPVPATSRSLSKSSTPNVSSTKQKTQPAPSPSAATSDLYEKLGLSDDSYIVEAPSFVVPYLIEKAGEKDLKKAVAQFADKPKEEKPAEKPAEEDEDVKEKANDSAEEDSSDSGTKPTASSVEEGKTTTAAPKKEKKESEEEDYFSGAIGKFFLDIGLSLVQEYVQEDLLRIQKRKISKGKKIRDPTLRVPALEKNLEQTRQKNAPLKIKLRQCDRCNFRTESSLVLAQHWSSPLNVGSGTMAKCVCHYCDFEASETPHVALHIQQDHQLRPTVEAEAAAHQCPLCPFEDSAKGKVSRHMASCQKRFLPQRNLEPPVDWEPPAKIPRLPARGIQAMAAGLTSAAMGLVASGKGGSSAVPFALPSYHLLLPKSAIGNQAAGASAGASPGYRMLSGAQGQAYLQSGSGKGSKNSPAGLSGLKLPAELHVVQNAQSRAGLPFSSKGSSLGRQGSSPASLQSLYPNAITNSQVYQQLLQAQGSGMSIIPSTSSKSGGLASGLKKSSSGISLVPGLVSSKGLTIQSTPSPSGKSRGAQQPSISITPLPRSTSSAAPSAGVKTSGGTPASGKGTQQAATGNKNAISCEICDGVIKDMEQLRHHMQWIHKVKIHPKMIHNRPPLNCQKCQSRFFTDQGLERHLLGSHGLVTSSMQEAANRGQDGGRCPICGKVHQWKLLSHVVKDHGLTLKPAHLSYKCTVCTATFGMYKLFETHVYTAHSVVARKVLDKDKEKDSKSNSSAAPLRINDEITIIPQPAAGDSDQPLCRSCGNGYDLADAKRQVKKLQAAGNLASQDCEKTCPSCLRKAAGRAERQGASVDVIDLSDDEVKNVSLPKSQVTITKVPAATKGEPQEKRARTENITEN